MYRFVQKTKRSISQLEKRAKKGKVVETSVAIKKARSKPIPVPVVNKTVTDNVVNKNSSTAVPEKSTPEKKVKDSEPVPMGKE